jgi:hypothetical protein
MSSSLLSGSVTASSLRNNLRKFVKCVTIALNPATGIHYTDPLVNAVWKFSLLLFRIIRRPPNEQHGQCLSNVAVDGIHSNHWAYSGRPRMELEHVTSSHFLKLETWYMIINVKCQFNLLVNVYYAHA